ncbi:ATP-binding protein [Burkholderia multivorans]|uniref:ATP-binding protein n=1 Tax=Burkholderia multivorans TaxID=87883 RepID=UPI001C233E73|nr:ATP-binding protein [Burkholderia multivorans]MBU9368856.1 ATP-binding protein [Burkholderia multivorans]HDR9017867.1 ATP-binding protein [Burkholderia vietnamiensis]
MTIAGFNEATLGERIGEVLSSARPVRSIEKLKGRDNELITIERALYAPGRSVFIYGDRGVGKSSLGATAAYQWQSSDNMPIIVGGSQDETFETIIANIANQALGLSRVQTVKKQSNFCLEWRGIRWSEGHEVSAKDITAELRTIGDAADLLAEIARAHSARPVVLVDEFDTIPSADERNRFAGLLKTLGDREINLKFIFTGVGSSLDELLGAHQSAYRQLTAIEVNRLGWEARREIVVQAAQEFGLDVDDNVNWRIAIVSDGFPYYVHLITEHMLWQAMDDDADCHMLSMEHYQLGLRKAIQEINVQLKRPYEKAVLHRTAEWEDLVWSTADGDDLWRQTSDMYRSYVSVTERRNSGSVLDSKRFSEAMRRLKSEPYGPVLEPVPQRAGWYTYKEKMLRGYVRMQAEACGIELSGETVSQKQRMHVPASVRSGYHESRVPSGIRLRDDKGRR